jgi:glycosyltransferase involved in cell wall biosynthesis
VKVLLMKEALPSGGAERQLALITEYLPERWERRVWTMGGGPFVEVIRQRGQRVDVSARAARLDVRPAADLWRLLRDWRPDVVHSWDWMSTLAALPVCRALGIPIVDGTIRNGIARRRRSLPLRAARTASKLIVANSLAGLEAWGVGAVKGRVVYNAFDPERWSQCDGAGGSPGERPAPVGQPGLCTVVMTGRMVAHKDFATVIAAAAELDTEEPGRWRFVLLGDGPERPRLAALAGELVERDVVAFVDPGLEVLPLVREADVGVLMSNEAQHREGCSNAIMEYMACRLPVVCSAGGGNPELVLHGETGFLVTAGDCGALVSRLRALAADRELARRMGDAGRVRLSREFTVARLVGNLERVYWEALS